VCGSRLDGRHSQAGARKDSSLAARGQPGCRCSVGEGYRTPVTVLAFRQPATGHGRAAAPGTFQQPATTTAAPDDSGPSITALAAKYGVSHTTMAKALRRMAEDGLVKIVPQWDVSGLISRRPASPETGGARRGLLTQSWHEMDATGFHQAHPPYMPDPC
jgi:Bacterial regulatory proteins, gntR family